MYWKKESESEVAQSCPTLFNPILWTVALQAPLSMGFSRQEYWSGWPFPSPGDLPDQGSNPGLPHCRQTLYCLSHQGLQVCFIFFLIMVPSRFLSCPALCDPMDCSPPDFPAHRILQARILKWVAISASRGSSQPRDWTISYASCIGRQVLYH